MTLLSAPTVAPLLPGGLDTSWPNVGRRTPVLALWPPWPADFRTRQPRRLLTQIASALRLLVMAELVTAVKYKLPIVVVIVKNNTLGQIKWEQMVFLGNPEYGVDLAPIDFVKFAEACGAVGFRIDDPKECGAILDRALSANTRGPVVIEAVVDPFEAPMPAKVTFEQAAKFTESLVRGEPNRKKIIATQIADKVRELV